MSSDIAAGRSSRRIMVIAAAALAVAMMLAVPIFVAADSDADFTADEAGYRIDTTDPTDDDLASVGLTSRAAAILGAISSNMDLFDQDTLGTPVVTADSLKVTSAEGDKIESEKSKGFYVEEVSAENVKITFTVAAAGTLMDPDTSSLDEKELAAYNAIKEYLGNALSPGDTFTITGKINESEALSGESSYKMLDGSKCIRSGSTMSVYAVQNTSLTLTLKQGEVEKSITFNSDIKGTSTGESKYEFQGDVIQVGTKYTVKNSVSFSIKGDSYYTVGDKDYSLYTEPKAEPDEEMTVESYDIDEQSSVTVSTYLKTKIAGLPASTDKVKVDKTYSGAESAFDDVMMDAVGKDLLKLLLIIGGVILGVIVLIIILVIVLLHMRKKKRQQ